MKSAVQDGTQTLKIAWQPDRSESTGGTSALANGIQSFRMKESDTDSTAFS